MCPFHEEHSRNLDQFLVLRWTNDTTEERQSYSIQCLYRGSLNHQEVADKNSPQTWWLNKRFPQLLDNLGLLFVCTLSNEAGGCEDIFSERAENLQHSSLVSIALVTCTSWKYWIYGIFEVLWFIKCFLHWISRKFNLLFFKLSMNWFS